MVDQTRRHMQKLDNENRRCFDPVLAIKEIQAAGFELEDYSDLHYRLDDELLYEVGHKTVTGNTDRSTRYIYMCSPTILVRKVNIYRVCPLDLFFIA